MSLLDKPEVRHNEGRRRREERPPLDGRRSDEARQTLKILPREAFTLASGDRENKVASELSEFISSEIGFAPNDERARAHTRPAKEQVKDLYTAEKSGDVVLIKPYWGLFNAAISGAALAVLATLLVVGEIPLIWAFFLGSFGVFLGLSTVGMVATARPSASSHHSNVS